MEKEILRLFLEYSRYSVWQRNLALFFPMFATAVNGLVAPYMLAGFIDRLQSGSITLANSLEFVVGYAVLIFIGEVILWRLALYFCWTFEMNGQYQLFLTIFEKLGGESARFHANHFGGSLVSQSSKVLGAFERFWDMIVWNIIPMLTTVFGSIFVMILLGLWQYAIFLGAYAILFTLVVFFMSRKMLVLNEEEASASTKTSGYLSDMVINVMTVKSFGREAYEQKRAENVMNTWREKSFRLKWGVIRATSIFGGLLVIGLIGALIFVILGSESGIVSLGVLYLVFTYAVLVNGQLWRLNDIIRTFNKAIGDATEMTKILVTDTEVRDRSEKLLHVKNGDIAFRNVSFTHDNGAGEKVFQNFSLEIPAGQRVGIVGHSGSGKTTLTRILLRFSDIDAGEILIDGKNIAKVSQKSLHEAIAYVPQDPLLFHRSLVENIGYGKPNASRDEIIIAATRANATEFIEKLPKGFDTLVGERGIKLSGGQRQRVAIARAILKDAPILVLDEATSALDSESEKFIQQSFGELMKNRTSIVIAHRLSTIAKLDRIIVLDEGKIIEDGTHTDLLARNGIYAQLWSHQSGGFIQEE